MQVVEAVEDVANPADDAANPLLFGVRLVFEHLLDPATLTLDDAVDLLAEKAAKELAKTGSTAARPIAAQRPANQRGRGQRGEGMQRSGAAGQRGDGAVGNGEGLDLQHHVFSSPR